jgi:hypothetical protein
MRLYIIRFFILLGLFFSSLAFAAAPAGSPSNSRVFAYAEANFPSTSPMREQRGNISNISIATILPAATI